MRRKLSTRAAEELIEKLEAQAREADAGVTKLTAAIRAGDATDLDTIELNRLIERATSYAHAAELARNLLEAPR